MINRRTVLALLACMAAMIVIAPANAANPTPTPDNDPFYTPPAHYQSKANGTILKDRKLDAAYVTPLIPTRFISGLGSAASKLLPLFDQLENLKIDAYQVLYKSTDSHDQPVAEAATILVPQGPWTGSGTMGANRPLVAFQSAEDSVSTSCQPSYVLHTGLSAKNGGLGSVSQFDVALSFPLLLKGYAVVYADYEGPNSEWLAGKQAGHAVLDGIRAATHYDPGGLSPETQIALWGYSGGGGATGWTAALAQVYAPELDIVGAAIGANSNADLANVYNANNGSITKGFLPMALVGLKRAFPDAGIDQYANAKGKQLLERAGDNNACTIQNLLKFSLAGKIEQYTVKPNQPLTESAPARIVFNQNSLVKQPLVPSMPILSYHDVFDTLVPVKGDNDLMQKYCRAGATVEIARTATPLPIHGLIHALGAVEGELPALHYLENRFKGVEPRNDCPASDLWASGRRLPYYGLRTQ